MTFIYRPILSDGDDRDPDAPTAHIGVFANEPVDPTSREVALRMRRTARNAKGQIALNTL